MRHRRSQRFRFVAAAFAAASATFPAWAGIDTGPCIKNGYATAPRTPEACLASGGTWLVSKGGDRMSGPLLLGGSQIGASGGRTELDSGQVPAGVGESGDAQNARAAEPQTTVPQPAGRGSWNEPRDRPGQGDRQP